MCQILDNQNANIISMNESAVAYYKELIDMDVDSREKFVNYIVNMSYCTTLELQTEVNQRDIKRDTTMRDALEARLKKMIKVWKKFQL